MLFCLAGHTQEVEGPSLYFTLTKMKRKKMDSVFVKNRIDNKVITLTSMLMMSNYFRTVKSLSLLCLEYAGCIFCKGVSPPPKKTVFCV